MFSWFVQELMRIVFCCSGQIYICERKDMFNRIFDLIFRFFFGFIMLWLVLLVVTVVLQAIAVTKSEQITTTAVVSIKESEVSSRGGLFILKEPFLPDGRNGSPKILWTPLYLVDFSSEIEENSIKITYEQTVMPDWWYKIAIWKKDKRPMFHVARVVLPE